MTLDHLKLILLLIVLTTFLSCKGQVKTEKAITKSDANSIVKLDEKIWSIYQDKKNSYWFGRK